MKRIGFVSTRISGTDGATLDTYKWYQVLERNGYECYFFAGELDVPPERSFLEPKAHFEHPEILELHKSCFGTQKRKPQLTKHIQQLKDYLKSKLRKELGFSDEDLFILQPTRIVPQKWIERVVELASLLGMEHPRLVIPHESGDEGELYALRVLEYCGQEKLRTWKEIFFLRGPGTKTSFHH